MIWESHDSQSERELVLESYRVQAEALQKELEYKLGEALKALDTVNASKGRYEKQVIKLENECRRLDNENQQLREELKCLKHGIRSKSEFAPHGKTTSSVQVIVTKPSEPVPASAQLEELACQLTALQAVCREQGGKMTMCLGLLRKCRQDNAELTETVATLRQAVRTCDCRQTSSSPSECESRVETYPGHDTEYCRLLDEIQDLTDSFEEESMFHCLPHSESTCLVSLPMQEKMQLLESEMSSMQQSLHGLSGSVRRRTCGTQTPREIPKKPERRQSFLRPIVSQQKWSLLV